MVNQKKAVSDFLRKNPSYQHIRGFIEANEWGDITHHGKILAVSDLHELPLEEIGDRQPAAWTIVTE